MCSCPFCGGWAANRKYFRTYPDRIGKAAIRGHDPDHSVEVGQLATVL
jgi:hypothetical protein